MHVIIFFSANQQDAETGSVSPLSERRLMVTDKRMRSFLFKGTRHKTSGQRSSQSNLFLFPFSTSLGVDCCDITLLITCTFGSMLSSEAALPWSYLRTGMQRK